MRFLFAAAFALLALSMAARAEDAPKGALQVAAEAKSHSQKSMPAPQMPSEADMLRLQRNGQATVILDLQLELAKARAELEQMKASSVKPTP